MQGENNREISIRAASYDDTDGIQSNRGEKIEFLFNPFGGDFCTRLRKVFTVSPAYRGSYRSIVYRST